MGKAWNDFTRIKTCRKPHKCITCGRIIHPGFHAHNYVGNFEGDFQNWYMCDYCYTYVLPQIPAGECFDTYYELHAYLEYTNEVCPECGWKKYDARVHRDKDDVCKYTVTFGCGHHIDYHIPINL